MEARSIKLLLFLFALTTGLVTAQTDDPNAGSSKAKPFNVLLIIIDDVAATYGIDMDAPVDTPNIRRIASRGTWFSNAYCDAPACNPSRVAMLTSVHASRSGIYYNSQKTPDHWTRELEFLPARFKNSGYLTAGYGKIAHDMKASIPDYSEGFVKRHNIKGQVTHPDKELRQHIIPGTLREAESNNFTWGILPDTWDREDPEKWQQDTEQANRTIDLLRKNHDRPFFVACGFWRPHVTWEVPQRYYDMHPLDEIEVPKGYDPFDLEDLPRPGRWIAKPTGNHPDIVSHGLWKKALQGYYASVSYIDEQIGRLLDELERSTHRDNTVVVFMSDNGMHLGEKDHWLKYALWEQTCRVFFSISVPDYPNQIAKTPVSLIDLYPTLMSVCDIEKPEHDMDDIDLKGLLTGQESTRGRPVLSTYGRNNHAIRDDRFRYIRYRNGDEELYDHQTDPYDLTNLADDDRFEEVKVRLASHLPKVNAPDAEKSKPGPPEWSSEAFE